MNTAFNSLFWVLISTGVLCTYRTDGHGASEDNSCNKIQCGNSDIIIIDNVTLESKHRNNCTQNNQQEYLTLLKNNCNGSETCRPLCVDKLPVNCKCKKVSYTCTGTETTGQTTAGQTTAGQTTTVQTTAGQTTAGKTTAGKTTAGQTTAGKTTTGQTAGGQTTDGRTVDVQTAGGQTAGGQTAGATQDNGSNVAIGVTVALLVLIGISVLVFCFVLHRRKRNARNQDSQTSDTDKNLFFYIDLVCGYLTKPRGSTTSPEATNVRHSDVPDNGYADIKDVEKNIYNEPTDIEPDVTQNNDTQYNRIQFQGPEIVLDPRYGRLNSKEIPKQDPQYSHVTETGFKEKSSQYSHITGAFSDSSSDMDGQHELAHPGIHSADDTYNHTDNRAEKSTMAPSDEDQYSHLGHDNDLKKSKSRMVNVGATSDMNNEHLKPYPGTVEKHVVLNSPEGAQAARYSLAKPFPNGHNLADLKDNSSHYEVARHQTSIGDSTAVVERDNDMSKEQDLKSTGNIDQHPYFILEPLKR